MTLEAVQTTGHPAGTPGFRRLNAALWCAGAGTFTLLYAVQGLLPAFSSEYGVSPATASLSLSVATGALALGIIPVSVLAEAWGRDRVMAASLTTTALLGVLAPLAPSFEVLVALRGLQGLAMAGVPALAMGHLAREVDGRALGAAMGVLIAGNTVGGLSGRVVATLLADLGGWRLGMAGVAVVSFGCLIGFRVLLPTPRFDPPPRVPLRLLG
ncbi:MAG: MFS transporter, partial [Nocardioides sp.]